MAVFSHILNRALAHAPRFSSTPQHFTESVAEHSFYTASIVMILADLLKEAGEEVDKERAVAMALVHDAEEMFSGDILNPFKHYSPEVTEAIRTANRQIVPQVFEGLPDALASKYVELWNEDASGESREAQVVKAADRLSLLAKCKEEMEVGNRFFEEMYERQLGVLRKDETPWWEKIKGDVLPED